MSPFSQAGAVRSAPAQKVYHRKISSDHKHAQSPAKYARANFFGELGLTFGSANTWYEDSHLTSYVPCLAHTIMMSSAERMPQVFQ